jgi:hypothetical protein
MYEEMRRSGLGDPSYFQTSGSVRVSLSSALVDFELESACRPVLAICCDSFVKRVVANRTLT